MYSSLNFLLSIGLVLSRDYYFIKESKNYAAAKKYCNSAFGTELASLDKASDVLDIKKLIGGYSVIIGLRQAAHTGAGKSPNDFKFDDGTNPGYKPFANGEPNDVGGEDCVELYGPSGKLNDIGCSHARYFVCNAIKDYKIRKYYKTNKVLNWENGNQYCKNVYGTTLATWRNAADYYNLHRIIGGETVFVGLYQKNLKLNGKSPDHFVFLDDPKNLVKYKPFNKGEPNNAGGENCAELMGGNGKLNDLNCKATRKIICNAATYAIPKKYVLVPTGLDFKKANQHCIDVYGTELATFRNGVDFYEFQQTMKGSSVWVGMYQKDQSKPGKNPRDFEYIDGSSSIYRPFGPGEPNNLGGEDCVEYVPGTQLLNDLKCSNVKHFACNLDLVNDVRKYIDTGVGRNWKDGMKYCKDKYGTTLATFRHGSDYYEFEKVAKSRSTWVGLKSTVTKDDFEYVDGLKVNYKPFGPGEPNNSAGEDCVEYVGSLRRLNDLNCANGKHIVCNAKNYDYKPKPVKPTSHIYVATPMTFFEANKYCIEKFDTELIAVNNKVDFELVKNACISSTGKCWIGLTDNAKYTDDKEHYWFLDGSQGDFPGWLTNEPKIKNGNGCAYMNNNQGGKWATANCNSIKLPFLCAAGDNEITPRALSLGGYLETNKYKYENNNKYNENYFEINFKGFNIKLNIKYLFIGLICTFILIIGLVMGLSCSILSKNNTYKPVTYMSSDSDEQTLGV